MNWNAFFAFLAAGILLWFLYGYIRQNPGTLSIKNFSKTLTTLGFLGIGLIAFVALLVMLLRSNS